MTTTPLDRETVATFRQGLCHLLAFELQDQNDWPLYGIIWKDSDKIWHLLNQTETGVYVDALGMYKDQNEVLNHYPPKLKDPGKFIIQSVNRIEVSTSEPLFENEKAHAKEVAGVVSNWFYENLQ